MTKEQDLYKDLFGPIPDDEFKSETPDNNENENENEDDSLELIPDHLRSWKDNEIIFTKYAESDEDGEIIVEYEEENGRVIPVAAKRDLVVITGREKSRKTLFLQCILMSLWTNDLNVTMRFRMKLEDPLILLFDTEQPIRRTKKNLRRFYDMIGHTKLLKGYRVFNIRKFTYMQKIEFISHTIESVIKETGRNPDVIIVDQVGDLLPARDVNDQSGIDQMITCLNRWVDITGALMFAVIHTNRGGKDTNGKAGVALDQKSDCCFLTELDKNSKEYASTVINKHARERRVPEFTFRQDFNGRPRLLRIAQADFDD